MLKVKNILFSRLKPSLPFSRKSWSLWLLWAWRVSLLPIICLTITQTHSDLSLVKQTSAPSWLVGYFFDNYKYNWGHAGNKTDTETDRLTPDSIQTYLQLLQVWVSLLNITRWWVPFPSILGSIGINICKIVTISYLACPA